MPTLTPLGHAVSGAGGAMFALAITYPLDILKTRLQVEPTTDRKKKGKLDAAASSSSTLDAVLAIMRVDGVRGLYAGLPAGLLGTITANFTYFYYYNCIRGWWMTKNYGSSTLIELGLGAMAGALSQLTTIPVSVIITRQQTSATHLRQSFVDTWHTIVREEGITGLWTGLKPSLVLVINPAITYGMFERLKTWRIVDKGRALKSSEVFVLGALAKTLATVITYPYIMAKVRLQWKVPVELQHDENLRYTGAIDVLRKVLKTSGFKGWYKGMQAQIIKAVLSQALLFMLKDRLDKYTLILFIFVRNLTNGKIASKRN